MPQAMSASVTVARSSTVEPTAGVWEGEKYDGIQRDIRYNHVGLGPEGWGRAGSEVSLRLDGAAVQVRGDAAPKGKDDAMKVLKVRGREFKLDAENEVAAAQGEVTAMEKKSDADMAELTAVKAALMDALQKVAALEAKQTAAAAAGGAAVTEEQVPDEVADSIAYLGQDAVHEAMSNTVDIARSCDVTIKQGSATVPTIGKPLLDYFTYANLYQPCAALLPRRSGPSSRSSTPTTGPRARPCSR